MKSTATLESVLREIAPSTVDDIVCSYMAQVLREEWSSDPDADQHPQQQLEPNGRSSNNGTEEVLVSTLAQFLDLDDEDDHTTTSHKVAQNIVETLIAMGLLVPHQQRGRSPLQEETVLNDSNDQQEKEDSSLRRLSTPTTILGKPEEVTQPVTVTEPSSPTTNTTKPTCQTSAYRERRKDHGKHHGSRSTKKEENYPDCEPQNQQQQQSEESSSSNSLLSPQSNSSTAKTSLHHNDLLLRQCRDRRRSRRACTAGTRRGIHLTGVTIAPLLADNDRGIGPELLRDTVLDILPGHRYGLIGRNGCGKSTLLQHLAYHHDAIPGLPPDLYVLLVEQQQQQQDISVVGDDDNNNNNNGTLSTLDVLVESDTYRTLLLQEQKRLESSLLTESEPSATSAEAAAAAAATIDTVAVLDELEDIMAELDAIHADTAVPRALEILQGLQFTPAMIYGNASHLSGGWRMRLALARALFLDQDDDTDLICLDECTNHLDLYGLDWLIRYINESQKTFLVVSHDRTFLDAICTDIIILEHQQLRYHVGNYSQYQQQRQEKAAREAQILDAAERQQTKAQAFVQKQQQMAHKKSADPNKQRQAKMMRDKKMDRIGNYREDGKRYKLRSLKKLDEKYLRLAQKVQIEVDEPVVSMHLANPTWPPSVGPHDAIVRLEDLNFGYATNDNNDDDDDMDHRILKNVTLSLNRGSKVALVGKNGSGKSTLVKLISGELAWTATRAGAAASSLWRHPNIRLAHLTQYAVEELEPYANLTVVEYAEQHFLAGRATSSILTKSAGSGNVRQYLGAFGLGGSRHAHRPLGTLSGGERMRLCLAQVLSDEPHCLLLDESTNHVDIETLESMAKALADYQGAVLMVSHNQAFLSGFCQELWVLEDCGRVTIHNSDTDSFDELFSQYRQSIARQPGSLREQRQQKATLAKRANKQSAGAQKITALL